MAPKTNDDPVYSQEPHNITSNMSRRVGPGRGTPSSSSSSASSNKAEQDRAKGGEEEVEESGILPPVPSFANDDASPGKRVHGKVVIVTGANSAFGIGRAASNLYAQHGAKAIYICDYQTDNLSRIAKEISLQYGSTTTVHPTQLDVSDESAVQAVCDDAISKYGRLDIMFANAGISGVPSTFDNIDAESYMTVMKVNALGVFNCFKFGALAMKKTSPAKPRSGGSLIGTASVAGLRSNAGGTDYSASKAAVVSMAQTISYQLVGTGIRANAICPGLIETGMTKPVFDMARSRGTQGKIGQLNPLRRYGVADEIARVALFLGSDESSYVNGQAWAVCGGLSAGHPFVPGKLA